MIQMYKTTRVRHQTFVLSYMPSGGAERSERSVLCSDFFVSGGAVGSTGLTSHCYTDIGVDTASYHNRDSIHMYSLHASV